MSYNDWMRLIDFTTADPEGKGDLKRGLILSLLLVTVSLLLWAALVLVWKPNAAAPWRNTTLDAIEAGGVALTLKDTEIETTAATPVGPAAVYLSQHQPPAVNSVAVAGLATGADLFNSDTAEQNTVVQQQVVSNEHQFNVTIKYTDDHCLEKFGNSVSVPIRFKHGTAALKSHSITQLEAIVNIYHQCLDQHINISLAGQISAAVRPSLRQRREDEVKYFFLHMRIARERLRLPDQP